MTESPYHRLSMRERQIMDIVHRLGRATVAEVHERMPDAASYNSVRITMSVLEDKGHVTHTRDGKRYIYAATARRDRTRSSLLQHMLSTFFEDSPSSVVSTLLDLKTSRISDNEFDELARLIDDARCRKSR